MVRAMGSNIPVALHLDHGDSFELAQSCIDSGFSSVMIDKSALPLDENIAISKQVADYLPASRRPLASLPHRGFPFRAGRSRRGLHKLACRVRLVSRSRALLRRASVHG